MAFHVSINVLSTASSCACALHAAFLLIFASQHLSLKPAGWIVEALIVHSNFH
jgi:hypothetical protein